MAGGISLFVDQRYRRNQAQKFFVCLIAQPEIGCDHVSRQEGANGLGVAGANEFNFFGSDEFGQPPNPVWIAGCDGLQGVGSGFNRDRMVPLSQIQKRRIAVVHDRRALLLLNGGEGQIQVE